MFSGYMQDAGSTPATSTNNSGLGDGTTVSDKIENIVSAIWKYYGTVKK